MPAKLHLSTPDTAHYGRHRCGWQFAMQALKPLDAGPDGVMLDPFLERTHAWNYAANLCSGVIPYQRPWVGFLHNPPNMPQWFDYHNSPQVILRRPGMQSSLGHCKGIFVLSGPLRDWLAKELPGIPVHFLWHPTEEPDIKFDFLAYMENPCKRVVQIGYWLRRLHSIIRLPVDKAWTRTWLVTSDYAKKMRDEIESRTCDTQHLNMAGYEDLQFQPNYQYDEMLSRNVAFVHLYDSAACNAVIECIARNTPLVVNRIPSVVEYLGPHYPLFFDGDSLADAAAMVEDHARVRSAHDYLRSMDKGFLSPARFLEDFVNSPIYQSLPTPPVRPTPPEQAMPDPTPPSP